MPSKKSQANPIEHPSIPLDTGITLICDLLTEGRNITQTFSKQRADTWYTSVKETLTRIFGSDSRHIKTFCGTPLVIMKGIPSGRGHDPHAEDRRLARRLSERLASLEAIEAAAEGEWRRQDLLTPKSSADASNEHTAMNTHSVFIVHGRDDLLRETCARFIEKLGLDPIVLHEQPNAGRTIIEKFEAHADVGYAIVLLTADDLGGLADDDPADFRPRARQNVVFEMGFFAGKLGRSRVCALYESGVELPSDLSGLVYIQIDPAGAWKLQVARELKAAQLEFNMNMVV